ncbi:hypothetical protein ACFOW6_17635 [Fodinicurvata halophila]|uniref:Uncharacterized protein n=1 Tax=Fodinicurvata halophila TaxID=1419723 RepID=A0ABV8US77_9PROT
MNYYLDSQGVARATLPLELDLLRHFLEEDLQGATGLCEEIHRRLEDLQKRGDGEAEITGNAHHLTLTPEQVHIAPLFTDAAPLVLETSIFREVLESWQALLQQA